jgi:hypothetical protein
MRRQKKAVRLAERRGIFAAQGIVLGIAEVAVRQMCR